MQADQYAWNASNVAMFGFVVPGLLVEDNLKARGTEAQAPGWSLAGVVAAANVGLRAHAFDHVRVVQLGTLAVRNEFGAAQ